MKKIFTSIIVLFFFTSTVIAQQTLPDEIVFKIKNEAFQKSQIETLVFYFSDYAGPRLSGSKLSERAEKMTTDKLNEMGFSNVRVEKAADFPKGGWDNLKTYAAMTEPYYSNLTATPKAWSGSTNGLVQGDVIILNINSEKDIDNYKGKLHNRIVLMPQTNRYVMQFTPYATRHTDEYLEQMAIDSRALPATPSSRIQEVRFVSMELQQRIKDLLLNEKPAVLISGAGNFNVPLSQSVAHKYGDPEPISELVLPVEAHGRMIRLLAQNISVAMEVEVKNEFNDKKVINNVFAEIPGTDPKLKDEIVMIGGHLDSWHGGTGATDNGAGVAVMIEALRIIKETGVKPRRTIRIALWGGEEENLVGSGAYMREHFYNVDEKKPRKDYDKFALYLNMDNGSGKFRGIYLEENDMAFPFFKEWIKPLETIGFGVLSPRRTGYTDHVPFENVGLPSFQFIQDDLEYRRAYHTLMDTYERLIITDLQYNAAVVASLALSAAMDNRKIPPKRLSIK